MVIEKRSGDICDGCMDEFWLVQPGEHSCGNKDCGCNLTDLHTIVKDDGTITTEERQW